MLVLCIAEVTAAADSILGPLMDLLDGKKNREEYVWQFTVWNLEGGGGGVTLSGCVSAFVRAVLVDLSTFLRGPSMRYSKHGDFIQIIPIRVGD